MCHVVSCEQLSHWQLYHIFFFFLYINSNENWNYGTAEQPTLHVTTKTLFLRKCKHYKDRIFQRHVPCAKQFILFIEEFQYSWYVFSAGTVLYLRNHTYLFYSANAGIIVCSRFVQFKPISLYLLGRTTCFSVIIISFVSITYIGKLVSFICNADRWGALILLSVRISTDFGKLLLPRLTNVLTRNKFKTKPIGFVVRLVNIWNSTSSLAFFYFISKKHQPICFQLN